MNKKQRRELELDHRAYLSLVDRRLKDPPSTASLMAATLYLLEARKVRKKLEV